MPLNNDLIMQFVKATKDPKETQKETVVYGVIVESDKESDTRKYVKIDGSDLYTPIETTSDIRAGDRVTVMIKNHTATVTGNLTEPSGRSTDVKGNSEYIKNLNIVIADKVSAEELDVERARITGLEADKVKINEKLVANKAEIDSLQVDKLDADEAALKYATIQRLDATDLKVSNLRGEVGDFKELSSDKFEAIEGIIGKLDTTYANIDFTNIDKATMGYFYAQSGLIKNVVVGDQTITGELVGVTISGDRLVGNTIIAEKLVIKGSDGLYYKLNTDGMKVEAEQTDENSINGQVIKAKSITASKISVNDLVAFDATIGGFNIGTTSLYSGVKSSVGNTTRGIYMDTDGQLSVGDSKNFLKYYKDADGNYRLEISAKSVLIGDGSSNIESAIEDASKVAKNFMHHDSTNGLQIGDISTGVWKGFRTQITNAAFRILNSTGTVLASYGEKIVELGRNAADAVIKLCGGKGEIAYATDDDSGDDYLQISADKLRLKSSEMSSLYSMYTDESTRWEKSAVNVSPTRVSMYASECIDPSMVEKVEGWAISEFDIDGTNIAGTANKVALTGQNGATISAPNGNIELHPNGRLYSSRQILVSSEAKTKHNDGIKGWYIGADGTAHATHATGGPLIAFHFAGSTANTSTIAESAAGEIKINGMRFGVNKVLWSGAYYMNGSQTITLNEAVSKQSSGIILVFSYYENNAAKDHSFNTHFVSKEQIRLFPSCGHTFLMGINAGFSSIGSKYLLFTDTTITGHSGNITSGTNSGITFNNSNYVLRYVIGV